MYKIEVLPPNINTVYNYQPHFSISLPRAFIKVVYQSYQMSHLLIFTSQSSCLNVNTQTALQIHIATKPVHMTVQHKLHSTCSTNPQKQGFDRRVSLRFKQWSVRIEYRFIILFMNILRVLMNQGLYGVI